MSALPPNQTRAMREHSPPVNPVADSWDALHATAARIAGLAGLKPERIEGALAAFPARFLTATEWQRRLAMEGIEDIAAMLHHGLGALDTLVARGGEASAPALALWREFHEARSAILALIDMPEPERVAAE